MSLVDALVRTLRAGTRALAIISTEEARALAMLESCADRLDRPMRTWSAATGIDGGGREREAAAFLARASESEGEEVWVAFELCAGLRDFADRRRLRELAQRTRGPALILIEPRLHPLLLDLPELGIEHLALPDRSELAERVDAIAKSVAGRGDAHSRTLALALERDANAIAEVGLGLELEGFDRLIAEALVDAADVREWVGRHKPERLARDGLLEAHANVPIDELGGLDHYVEWLGRRALALDPRARSFAIPAPRGALLVGVQGCGKSLAARASADRLGLPLFRLDLGRLFGGTVGESEANLRRATATLERMAPIVLWLDEIDKGLAGVEGSRSDGGTSARVVGSLLTWLQERNAAVFVVATANRIEGLPPELLRRGRLDELFFVDLPDQAARVAILLVHLERAPQRVLGRVPPLGDPREDFMALAEAAEGYSGAEIEAALIDARLGAFARGEALRAADLRSALQATVPLSRSHAEAIAQLRRWAETRARRA